MFTNAEAWLVRRSQFIVGWLLLLASGHGQTGEGAPTIGSGPATQTILAGQPLLLRVVANGAAPLAYQWQKNGVNLPGATNATYAVAATQVTDAGTYRVLISNTRGSTTAPSAAVMIIRASSGLSTAEGVLSGSGLNQMGQLGDGTYIGTRMTRQEVTSGVIAASAGNSFSLFLKANGSLWGTGDNRSFQLGARTPETVNIPLQIATDVGAIAAGFDHTLFIKTDGSLWAVGRNTSGQLGDGSADERSSPVLIASNAAAIAAADWYSAMIKTDGTLWMWGNNGYGTYGDGTRTTSLVPKQVASDVKQVAVGHGFTIYLKRDGTLWGAGYNEFGQLGQPVAESIASPVLMATSVVQISAGFAHTLYVKADGTLWGTGTNISSQLGYASPSYRSQPIELATGVVAAFAGNSLSHFIKSDGTLWGLGSSGTGAMGIAIGGRWDTWQYITDRVVGVSSVGGHALFLRAEAPIITTHPESRSVVAGTAATLAVTATGIPTPAYQWRKDGVVLAGATQATLALQGVNAAAAGSYTVHVSNGSGVDISRPSILTVVPPLAITAQPVNVSAIAGQPAVLTVSATGHPVPAFQWRKDGVPIVGATSATYTVASASASAAGLYDVVVTDQSGTVTSGSVLLTVLPAARLANLSIRTELAASQAMSVGFVATGGSKDVLLRAAGPALTLFGLSGVMSDPRLELYRDGVKVFENDNWPGTLAETFASVGAFAFPPNSRDAALLRGVEGASSAVVSGTTAGTVLVEAYDAGGGIAARLVNLSARNRVGAAPNVLIAGFHVAGAGTLRVMIRGAGPTLVSAPFNVPGVLTDPRIELFDATGTRIAENDNWEGALAETFAGIGAFPFIRGSRDAALVATLSANQSYTVQLSGADGGAGDALIEIYELR